MNNYSQTLLRSSALFAVIGAMMGAHMAGSGTYVFRPIHAHILVVGWLSLFAWAVYYKVFDRKVSMLAKFHVWSAMIGSIGLTAGMWLHSIKPFNISDSFTLVFYIAGGTILLISFILFFFLTLLHREEKS